MTDFRPGLSMFRAAVACFIVLGAFGALDAQDARSVSGRVVRVVSAPSATPGAPRSPGTDTGTVRSDSLAVVGAPSVMVTLHRVGKDSQAPLDSMRTSANGTYSFKYKTSGINDAVYFTSVSWGGIAYFTAPLRTAVVSGADAEITVFDTTTRTFPLKVSGRHLIISASDTSNHRTIVEVFELSNDSILTLVAGPDKSAAATWSVVVPKEARDLKAGDGESSADTFRKIDDRIAIYSAVAPGIKQVSFSYRLPNESFPLPFVVEHGAVVLEVLLEDPMGTVTGGGLVVTDPVTLENRNFRRFLAQDVADGASIEIKLPSGPSVGRNMYIAGLLVAIGTIMLLILWRAMQRNRAPAYVGLPPVRVKEAPLTDRLAREIADLDATFARYDSPNDAVKLAYEERRAELKDALAAAMAKG
ncbi:MAG: hypothetical protein H7Z40_09155 [Phycisphaerae bacterium]|nr:hypothetical protein [Gemmatimonadaceae bacterium]